MSPSSNNVGDFKMRHRSQRKVLSSISATLLCLSAILSSHAVLGKHALQSGPDVGPSYAGGMAYDKDLHVVYLTGATYGLVFDQQMQGGEGVTFDSPLSSSACFLGIAKLPTSDDSDIEWIERETYGTATVPESCVSIALAPNTASSRRAAYIIGSTEETGLLTDIRFPGSHKAKEYGIILDVSIGDGSNGKHKKNRPTTLLGGALIQDEMVQYPRTIVADPLRNYVYVASMHTEETTTSPEFDQFGQGKEFPNWTKGGLKKFGTDFGMLVERLQVDEITDAMLSDGSGLSETLSHTWRKPFSLTIPSSSVNFGEVGSGADAGVVAPHETNLPNSVVVNHMVELPSRDALVIVGSTPGTGPAFGEITSGLGDMDGFMVKLNANTGNFDALGVPANRLESSNFKDDWITHICTGQVDDGMLFVVGVTAGQLDPSANVPPDNSVDAFIAMIDFDTLEPVWTKQFPVTGGSTETTDGRSNGSAAYGIGCSVTSDDQFVYFAGVVDKGAALDGLTSKGGDDIFVAQLSTSDGTVQWMKQMGTSGNERLAHGGGVVCDKDDNAVVYGDTTGAMYRDGAGGTSEKNRDIFVVIFNKDNGGHATPGSGFTNNGGTADGGRNEDTSPVDSDGDDGNSGGPQDIPAPPVGGDGDAGTEPPVGTNPPVATKPPKAENPSMNYDGGKATTSKSKFILVTLFLIVVIVASLYFVARLQHEKEVATERSHVFSYLNGFDVEDVDLRHSATGGWHGTYVNKLAHGVNKADSSSATNSPSGSSHNSRSRTSFSFENAPLTHSSVVRDSLFMDVDSKPSLGGGSIGGSSEGDMADDTMDSQSRGSGSYDGLIGAYDDLKPRSYSDRKNSLQSDDEDKPWGRDIV